MEEYIHIYTWSAGLEGLRWEDCVAEDVERLEAGIQLKEAAEDRDRWRNT